MFAVCVWSMSIRSSLASASTSACIRVVPVKAKLCDISTLSPLATASEIRLVELSVASMTPAAVGQSGASKWLHPSLVIRTLML